MLPPLCQCVHSPCIQTLRGQQRPAVWRPGAGGAGALLGPRPRHKARLSHLRRTCKLRWGVWWGVWGWCSLLTTASGEWQKYFEFHNARLGCCIGKYYGQTFDWKSFNWWKWKLILKSFKNFVLISNELLIKSMLKLSTLACWIVRNLTNIFDRNNLI